MKTMSYSDQR